MKATQQKVSKLIGHAGKQFIIPIYQRRYTWNYTSVQQLLDDIEDINIENNSQTHFLNSIVYSKLEESAFAGNIGSNVEKFHIIDGQQRLTTLSILLIALRDILYENDLDEEAKKIDYQYILNPFENETDLKVRLQLSEKDHDIYKKLALRDSISKENQKSTIYKNYTYIRKYIEKNMDKNNFINTMLKKFEMRIDIIETFLEQDDNPQKIFSSLNSTGEELKASDLVKNYILMPLTTSQQKDFFKRYWLEIEKHLLNNDRNLLKFLQHYLTMKLLYVVSNSGIYDAFENYYSKLSKKINKPTHEVVEYILSELRDFSEQYANLFLLKNNFTSIQSSLNLLKIESYFPLLMKVQKFAPTKVEDVAQIIESYLVRRIVVGLQPGKTKGIFVKVLKNVDFKLDSFVQDVKNILLQEEKLTRYPANEEFKTGLKIAPLYLNSNIGTKYILYRLENYFNEKSKTKTVDYDSLTIEHILPQTQYIDLNPCWTMNFDFTAFEKLLHVIGNLTLITQEKNSQLGNKCFELKQPIYESDTVRLTMELSDDTKYDDWTVQTIEERSEDLIKKALEVWSL